jgi:hypothetical protein
VKLSKPEREAIRAREQAATPGPWAVAHELNVIASDGYSAFGLSSSHPLKDGSTAHQRNKANALFAAHAREDVPYLLSALDEAEAENERLYEMLGWISRKTTEGEIFGAIEHLRWHLANPKNKECQHG